MSAKFKQKLHKKEGKVRNAIEEVFMYCSILNVSRRKAIDLAEL